MTQPQFAIESGYALSYISKIVRKTRRPSWDAAEIFAALTGTDPAFWFTSEKTDIKLAIRRAKHEEGTENITRENGSENQISNKTDDNRYHT